MSCIQPFRGIDLTRRSEPRIRTGICARTNSIHFFIEQLSDHFYLYTVNSWPRSTYVLGKLYVLSPLPYRSHAHIADRIRLFDRYSNTLLVSLNNRISIRDTYGARAGAVDRQDVAGSSVSNNSRSESPIETMITEIEKPQLDFMRQLEPVPETEIEEEWVIGELRGRHAIVSYLSYLEQLRDQRLQTSRDADCTNR